ncbi:hypothetical protein EVG20_g11230 [Dentipellis fragilis]|uniref:Uncharacterized protein n=1 Tax=Dentipellis fragilis TaxID=205917 RepID=A0A4Y9XNL1_9AGAM|nr:hypothetical protein EVG20_g11230 [Dentipellis fragilis]
MFSVPHPTIMNLREHIDGFRTSILQHFPETERSAISLGLNLNSRTVEGATVHAEALMMALAHSVSSPSGRKDLQDVLNVNKDCEEVLSKTEQSNIAVSKKCCWCCWQLYRYWNRDDSDGPSTSVEPHTVGAPRFALLGIHSTVYPWSPPPVGVPIEFLRMLATKLQKMLIDVLKSSHRSRQEASLGTLSP